MPSNYWLSQYKRREAQRQYFIFTLWNIYKNRYSFLSIRQKQCQLHIGEYFEHRISVSDAFEKEVKNGATIVRTAPIITLINPGSEFDTAYNIESV